MVTKIILIVILRGYAEQFALNIPMENMQQCQQLAQEYESLASPGIGYSAKTKCLELK